MNRDKYFLGSMRETTVHGNFIILGKNQTHQLFGTFIEIFDILEKFSGYSH